MEEKVLKAIRTCLRKEAVLREDVRLQEDLEFDSVDMLMLISELEAEFNIQIQEEDFTSIRTVGDVMDQLRGIGHEGIG